MKVAHFNTFPSGGSSVLLKRLHKALLSIGVLSQVFFRISSGAEDEDIKVLDFSQTPWGHLKERARYTLENRVLKESALSYYSRLAFNGSTAFTSWQHDICHLHWVARWLDLPSFVNSLPSTAPVVWTVHDMSALAGGCFTDFGCREFEKACRACPLLKFPFNRIWARHELQQRIRALATRSVAFVANSRSTFSLVERSLLAKGKVHRIIPPGFNFATFKKMSRAEARAKLGIPSEAFLLGFGAASLTDQNKGINRFYEVAERLAQKVPHTQALIFGDGKPNQKIPTHHAGPLKDTGQLALAYSAMDAHLVTSQMETFGQVAVEAQACGIPVFAFAVGGIPETLVDGKTGVLIPFGQCEDMAEQIVAVHRAGRLEDMGQAAAEWVRGQFDSLVVAKKYVEVYEELLAGTARG